MIILFDKQAGQTAESWGFFLNAGSSVVARWRSGTDPVNLQVKVGDNYDNVLDNTGTPVALTPTAPSYTINGAGTYRVTAGSTSSILATASQGI